MTDFDRRQFLLRVGAGALAAGTTAGAFPLEVPAETSATSSSLPGAGAAAGAPSPGAPAPEIDFRYSPVSWQTAICFPDDPHKTLVGERGDLRYRFDTSKGIGFFSLVFEFALDGMQEATVVEQRLEAPHIPIVRTELKTGRASWSLTTFASNREGEGRVDNVLLEVRTADGEALDFVPKLKVLGILAMKPDSNPEAAVVRLENEGKTVLFCADRPVRTLSPVRNSGLVQTDTHKFFEFAHARATPDQPARMFFRFPQQGQDFEQLSEGLRSPDALLEETRRFWNGWKPFAGSVAWGIPRREGEFLTTSARNILQAREVKKGRLTFQVGAADYRGLWIVDGHFILEAARYLGYDDEAQKGLESTWARQREDGGVFAGAGDKHYKDTAIALFSLVRQAELSQDWSYFRRMQPQMAKALQYIENLRRMAREEGGSPAAYGLLPRAMPDGGLFGARAEFTTTLWTLAALKAVADAAEKQKVEGLESAGRMHQELAAAFESAARQEARRHPDGFDYLPMLMKEDEQWSLPDEWDRPRPQSAQWALSQAIYPGEVLAPDHWVTQGHIRLMQAVTREDVPIGTGWMPHGSLWTYHAAFLAQVYLWTGMTDQARRSFVGFLNHSSPLYCWREEQPLQDSLIGNYVGDMPHNWASAECIRYLRHMLALEAGSTLRLLSGLAAPDLKGDAAYTLTDSPTRFGRVSLALEPRDGGRTWQLSFRRGDGPAPSAITLPARLGTRLQFAGITGTSAKPAGSTLTVDPASPAWSATWNEAG